MIDHVDVIIIGGGHNGLTCAAYLAKAGKSVMVLEANEQVGGMAVTREFSDGFKTSAVAHILHQLNPEIIRDLDLKSHGLELTANNIKTIALGLDEKHIWLGGGTAKGALSGADREAYELLHKRLNRFAKLLASMLNKKPPRLAGGDFKDMTTLAKFGLDLRMLGRDDMREFLRILTINICDLLDEQLESDLLKGALGFDAVLGTHLGPRSPQSLLTYLYRLSGQIEGVRGALAIPKGGMGSVTSALAKAAQAAGVDIRTSSPVASVLVENGRATGVHLATGETLRATHVVSNADPKTTFLDFVGARNLEAGFANRINNMRMRGNAAKLHLALDSAPEFSGLSPEDLKGRLVIAPSLDYVEDAFSPAKYGEASESPTIEITLPSLADRSLAPEGQHVLSAIIQYAPYNLKVGWDTHSDQYAELIIDLLSDYAPGLRDKIVGQEFLSPVDIERQFHVCGGHWHHGELTLDQMFMMRPVPGASQYKTPLPGLYLCGAGAHPGGGVMGLAGRNAAHALCAEEDSQ